MSTMFFCAECEGDLKRLLLEGLLVPSKVSTYGELAVARILFGKKFRDGAAFRDFIVGSKDYECIEFPVDSKRSEDYVQAVRRKRSQTLCVEEKEESSVSVNNDFFYLIADYIEDLTKTVVYVYPAFVVLRTGRAGRDFASDRAICFEEDDTSEGLESKEMCVGLVRLGKQVSPRH